MDDNKTPHILTSLHFLLHWFILLRKKKIYSLRLWLSFFCLSLAKARVSVSDQKENNWNNTYFYLAIVPVKKKNQKYMRKYNITYSKWYNKNFCKYLEIWNNILVRRQWQNLWDLNSKTWICILALHLVALGSLPKFSSVKLVWYLLNIIVMIKRSRAYGKY